MKFYLKFLNSEIEIKKEEIVPKRGDFFHLKVYRRPDGTATMTNPDATTTSKYNEPMADLSTTFKFAPGASTVKK